MALSQALNVRTEGSGTETLVFGHGFGTDQSIWDKIVPIFAEKYIQKTTTEAFVLFFGLNDGGFSSSDIEPLLLDIGPTIWASTYASLIVDPRGDISVDKFHKCYDPPQKKRGFHKCIKRMRAGVALPLAKTVFYGDYREMLHKVDTPSTVVQTTNDLAVPHSVALYMKKRIRGEVTLVIIDTNGHFPQLTAHFKLVEVLKEATGF